MRWLAWVLMLSGCHDVADSSARWSHVYSAVIEPNCATAGCHSNLAAAAGVDLATKEGAYVVLTGHVCGAPDQSVDPPRNYVTPGSAEYSQLMYQLRGRSPDGQTYRDPMPPDLPLPSVEVELVARWIDEGARCD